MGYQLELLTVSEENHHLRLILDVQVIFVFFNIQGILVRGALEVGRFFALHHWRRKGKLCFIAHICHF